MKKLGQHFLKNTEILKTIASEVAIVDDDLIIEIGPGHGELTEPLARAARTHHARVICVEKDHALIAPLEELAARENSQTEGGASVTIIEGDALLQLPEIIASFPREARYKIAGNIPYYITGKLLRVMSELGHKPERVVMLIQKEVAERICAAPPAMNRLAASVQFWTNPELIAIVPRRDFSPPPEVDSAVIVLNSKNSSGEGAVGGKSIDPAHYYRAVRAIFAQPGKTLLNNVAAAATKAEKKSSVAEALKKIGIDPAARPHDLAIEQIIAIAQAPLWG